MDRPDDAARVPEVGAAGGEAWWKIIRTIWGSVAACVALALSLAACGRQEVGPREAAERFFQRIAAGQMQEAYESAAFVFQSQQSLKGFESSARTLGLDGSSEIALGAPDITGDTAKLTAKVPSTNGRKSELVVTLRRESGAWRIFSLKSPRSPETGLSENPFSIVGKASGLQEAANFPVPDEQTMRDMVKEALGNFSDAIRQKSFSDFYDYVSYSWQQQLSRVQLQDAFKAFIDRDVDLSALAGLEPRFDSPPRVSADGILSVSGHYDTKPYVVGFSLKFIYELPARLLRKPENIPLEGARDWRLFGIDVNLRQ